MQPVPVHQDQASFLLSAADKQRFLTIRQQLVAMGHSETNFVKVELLFFEALDRARNYGTDLNANTLLAQLNQLKQGAYAKTEMRFEKKNKRERWIQQFINQFRKVLSGKEL